MSPGSPERLNTPASNLYKSYPAANAEPRVGTRAFGECLLIFRWPDGRGPSSCTDFSFLTGGLSVAEGASISSLDSKLRFVPFGFSSDGGSGEGGAVYGLDGAEDASNKLEGAMDEAGDEERARESG